MLCDEARRVVTNLVAELDSPTPYGPVLLPSTGHYTGIFAWDSAWHYFFLKEIDASRALAELRTLFATADADGRVPHETRFGADEGHGPLRRLQINILGDTYAEDGRSHFIDPPVYAWAAADAICEGLVSGEEGAELLEQAAASLAFLRRRRTLSELAYPYNELPLILHPLESGTDGSPQFDEIYRGPLGTVAAMLGLGRRLNRLQWDPRAAVAAGIPVIFDVTVVSFYLLGLQRIHDAALRVAEPRARRSALEGLPSAGETRDLVAAAQKEFWNADCGLSTSRWLRSFDGEPRRCETATLSGLLPLLWSLGTNGAGGAGAPDQAAAGILEIHGAPGGTFFQGELPRYTEPSHPTGRRERLSPLLWRGPCSWMNMNYTLWLLLRAGGLESGASLLAERAAESVLRLGPWEYMHAHATKGGGAYPFSWNGLVLPMLCNG